MLMLHILVLFFFICMQKNHNFWALRFRWYSNFWRMYEAKPPFLRVEIPLRFRWDSNFWRMYGAKPPFLCVEILLRFCWYSNFWRMYEAKPPFLCVEIPLRFRWDSVEFWSVNLNAQKWWFCFIHPSKIGISTESHSSYTCICSIQWLLQWPKCPRPRLTCKSIVSTCLSLELRQLIRCLATLITCVCPNTASLTWCRWLLLNNTVFEAILRLPFLQGRSSWLL